MVTQWLCIYSQKVNGIIRSNFSSIQNNKFNSLVTFFSQVEKRREKNPWILNNLHRLLKTRIRLPAQRQLIGTVNCDVNKRIKATWCHYIKNKNKLTCTVLLLWTVFEISMIYAKSALRTVGKLGLLLFG